jgi:UrcA family protein
MKTEILAAAAVIVAFGAPIMAQAAPAQSDGDTPQIVVKYADLNTATPAGQAVLRNRLSTAAEQVCGGRPNILQVADNQRFDACVNRALGAALAKIPAPHMVAGAPSPKG